MYIKNCRICSSTKLEMFLDLGDQPWCNDFVTKSQVGLENRYPLEICFCHDCTACQISYNVPKDVMYSNHLYLSSSTSTMRNHFQSVSNKSRSILGKSGSILDIGSNDGTLLQCYLNNNFSVLGVDPCEKIAKRAISKGIETVVDFFDVNLSNNILNSHGKFDIISAANVFYHIEDLHSVIKGVVNLLSKDGMFIIQASYLPKIMERRAFDIMYHEHLLYYRIETLSLLLKKYELEIFNIDFAEVHGGSVVVYARHKTNDSNDVCESWISEEKILGLQMFETYKRFGNSIKTLSQNIYDFVDNLVSRNATIYAFGAPAKGTVLLNYCGLSSQQIVCATENNHLKVGKYIPGTGIPIVFESNIEEPDYFLMLPWNFKNEFMQSEEFQSGKRKFIVPVPYPEILTGH